jgi:hypothetical protein
VSRSWRKAARNVAVPPAPLRGAHGPGSGLPLLLRPSTADHLGVQARFIEKHELADSPDWRLAQPPADAFRREFGPGLLGGAQRSYSRRPRRSKRCRGPVTPERAPGAAPGSAPDELGQGQIGLPDRSTRGGWRRGWRSRERRWPPIWPGGGLAGALPDRVANSVRRCVRRDSNCLATSCALCPWLRARSTVVPANPTHKLSCPPSYPGGRALRQLK